MGRIDLTEDEWHQRLTPEQYRILRKEGTERAFKSTLHEKKDKGVYKCAGCGTPLFTSDMKFESGTGWPSFFETLPGVFETNGKRYCNNGAALIFEADEKKLPVE